MLNLKPAPLTTTIKISEQFSFVEKLGVFQSAASALGPELSHIGLREPFNSCLLICNSLVGLVDASFVGFQS